MVFKGLIVFTYLTIGGIVFGATKPIQAVFVRVIDGDTFVVHIPRLVGMYPVFGRDISVRIKGINAPEMGAADKCERELAVKARDRAARLLKACRNYVVIVNPERDKYFRLLSKIMMCNVNVGDTLLKEKLVVAMPTDSKPKTDWCKP